MPAAPPDVDDDASMVRTRVRRTRSRRSWAKRKRLGWTTFGTAVLVLVLGLVFVLATWDHGRKPLSERISALRSAPPSATAPAVTAAPTTPATAPSTASSFQTSVRGTIAAVGDSRYTMTSNSGLTYTVIITPGTTFSRNRSFDSFSVGDPVSVRGTLSSGVITASAVNSTNAR